MAYFDEERLIEALNNPGTSRDALISILQSANGVAPTSWFDLDKILTGVNNPGLIRDNLKHLLETSSQDVIDSFNFNTETVVRAFNQPGNLTTTIADLADVEYGLSTNNVVAFFGDSRISQGLASGNRYGVRSFQYWMRLYSNQAFDTTSALNFGIGGQTTKQMLDRVDANIASMQAAGVGIVVFMGSINDGYAAETSISYMSQMFEKFRQANIKIVIVTETPNNTAAAVHIARRDWLRTQNFPEKGMRTVDIWDVGADEDDLVLDGGTVDGTHLSVWLCRELGKAVSEVALEYVKSPRDILPTVNEDVTLVGRNLVTNALMLGTSGTKDGAATGTVATGWALRDLTTGCAIACSKVDRDGYTWQQVVVSGTPTAAAPVVRLEMNVDTKVAALLAQGAWKEGKVVDGGMALKVTDVTGVVKSVSVQVVANPDITSDGFPDVTSNDATFNIDIGAEYEGVSRPIPRALTATGGIARLRLDITGVQNTAMGLTVQIGRAFMTGYA